MQLTAIASDKSTRNQVLVLILRFTCSVNNATQLRTDFFETPPRRDDAAWPLPARRSNNGGAPKKSVIDRVALFTEKVNRKISTSI